MFLLNLGWKWTFAALDGLRGAIVLPSANPIHRVVSEHPGEVQVLLIDPQLYLAGLGAESRTKTCGRLASYPWFGLPKIAELSAGPGKRRDKDNDIRAQIVNAWPGHPPKDLDDCALTAIKFQMDQGCTSVILPAPLIEEREDEGGSLGDWIDAGLRMAEELETAQPLLATVAVSQKALNPAAFAGGGLLEAIVDQVTARGGIDGVYIVIAQTGTPSHSFETHIDVVRAYLQLARDFARAGAHQVITNFADLAGLLSIGAGATAFASGQSRSQRRLHVEGFCDDGGGIALPHFYSHRTASEYLTETDLDRVVEKRLVRRISDETEASASLIAALRRGESASALPNWAESQNNVQAAHQHYLQRLLLEGNRLRKARPSDRLDLLIEWLESAQGNLLVMDQRLKLKTPIGHRPPLDRWRVQIEELLDQ
jgi:hypothetical protein